MAINRPNSEPLPPCLSPGYYSAYDPDHWRARRSNRAALSALVLIGIVVAGVMAIALPTLFGLGAAILSGIADEL